MSSAGCLCPGSTPDPTLVSKWNYLYLFYLLLCCLCERLVTISALQRDQKCIKILEVVAEWYELSTPIQPHRFSITIMALGQFGTQCFTPSVHYAAIHYPHQQTIGPAVFSQQTYHRPNQPH